MLFPNLEDIISDMVKEGDKREGPSHFIPSTRRPFTDIYRGVLRRHPLTGDLPAFHDTARVMLEADAELAKILRGMFIETQRTNGLWAEDRFRELRSFYQNSFLDGVVVGVDGRVVTRPWATLLDYTKDGESPPDMTAMVKLIRSHEELYFPITPRRDALFFYFHDDEERLKSLIRAETESDVPTENYPVNEQIASMLPSPIRMLRLARDEVKPSQFASSGITMGRLGFWDSPRRSLGRWVRRIYVDRIPLVGHKLVISPFTRSYLISSGALPMDEKYGIEVIRTNQEMAQKDFIAAALMAFKGEYPYPVVFRFNTYRPWLGEEPVHGQEKQTGVNKRKVSS